MPPWSPCGFAVDFLRSCYETEVRFYRDIPDTCRVRWSYVPEGTPFVPYPNSWVSSNWDSDPKPLFDIGELPEYGKPWVDGLPIGTLPQIHVCGTREQWSIGMPRPPAVPVAVDADGVPLCCGAPAPLVFFCLLLQSDPEQELRLDDGNCLLLE